MAYFVPETTLNKYFFLTSPNRKGTGLEFESKSKPHALSPLPHWTCSVCLCVCACVCTLVKL